MCGVKVLSIEKEIFSEQKKNKGSTPSFPFPRHVHQRLRMG